MGGLGAGNAATLTGAPPTDQWAAVRNANAEAHGALDKQRFVNRVRKFGTDNDVTRGFVILGDLERSPEEAYHFAVEDAHASHRTTAQPLP
jgi:hypothetical protein